MKKPNLFKHATSELSQDAFICWLLEWAKAEHKNKNGELHACGVDLIKAFFNKHSLPIPERFESVEIEKQYKNIDVFCIVNETIPIIIEDKTNTAVHSDQLKNYYKKICRLERFDERNIIPIYFKTHDQSNYDKVREDGYQEFTRKDILKLLDKYDKTGSDIYDNFRSNLHCLEESVQSYKFSPNEKDWSEKAWTGFFMELQKSLGQGNWRKVSNRRGGFMGFWWHFDRTNGIQNYLQLEDNILVFKVHTDNPEKMKSIRKCWHSIIQNLSREMCLPVTKPTRFGSGKSITVAVLKSDYRKFNEDLLDLDATLSTLKQAQRLLDKARSEYKSANLYSTEAVAS